MAVLAEMRGRDSSVGGENSGEDVGEDGTRAAPTLRGHITSGGDCTTDPEIGQSCSDRESGTVYLPKFGVHCMQGRRHGFWTGGAACPAKGSLAEGALFK